MRYCHFIIRPDYISFKWISLYVREVSLCSNKRWLSWSYGSPITIAHIISTTDSIRSRHIGNLFFKTLVVKICEARKWDSARRANAFSRQPRQTKPLAHSMALIHTRFASLKRVEVRLTFTSFSTDNSDILEPTTLSSSHSGSSHFHHIRDMSFTAPESEQAEAAAAGVPTPNSSSPPPKTWWPVGEKA